MLTPLGITNIYTAYINKREMRGSVVFMFALLPRVAISEASIYLIVYLNLLSFKVGQKATLGLSLQTAWLYITM